ncbi:MAG TPA: FecR domain-containing protein [Verrucomicrobiae bacterium]
MRVLIAAAFLSLTLLGFCDSAPSQLGQNTLLVAVGTIEVAPAGTSDFVAAHANQVLQVGDQVRSGKNSRATIRLSNLSVIRVYELTTMTIRPPAATQENTVIEVKSGSAYFFNRDKPNETQFQTPSSSGAIRGTEFALSVDDQGRTELALINGLVTLSNSAGSIQLESGEKGVVEMNQPPRKSPLLDAVNIIQWTLYYPAVLNPDELELSAESKQALADSLAAYRAGDLVKALAQYPASREPAPESERVYRAAVLLASGSVEEAQILLDGSFQEERAARLANALKEMIASVKGQSRPRTTPRILSTEWLAGSYQAQATRDLEKARAMAANASTNAPRFGFAGERLAELEFSFGHTKQALAALKASLEVSSRNAQAVALNGFLLSAQNHIPDAMASFNRAIELDGALGNAWLGRGLCHIKLGHTQAGLQDLLVAAALEPRRALLRSYLGKAFSDGGHEELATKELRLARGLDPNDPTVWLYLALLDQQENKINPAISDLQTAQADNDNRSVFRSRMLLDQDRAVASANLASVYRDAGMTDVSIREAARAVTDDYANESAHLFLSDSYYNLLDPTQFNLRYDTVWFNELLLANALAPVGAGRLSQRVSQQDYSKLFDSDGLSLAGFTQVRTDGMLHETASQFGTFNNTSYAIDLDYHHNNGVRVNNSLDNVTLDSTIKQQITPQDTAMLFVQYENYHSGDNDQYYDQSDARPFFKFSEQQQPELVATWHHEWAPGIHTLFMLDRLVDDQQFSDKDAAQLLLGELPSGTINGAANVPFDYNYRESFEVYGAELNQILQWDRVLVVAGGRYQSGEFHTQDQFSNPTGPYTSYFSSSDYTGDTTGLFQRVTGYGYLTVEPLNHLWLTGGVAADDEKFPSLFRNPPVLPGEQSRSQIGPKAALVWSPNTELTFRGIFTHSLGGASFDQTVRLEPTELAGFPQAFRSLISEEVVGSQSVPTFDTLGGAIDLKLGNRTFAGIQFERLASEANQGQGVFALENGGVPAVTSSTVEQLNYVEHAGSISLNQLLGDGFVLGGAYKITQSDLHGSYPDISQAVITASHEVSTLQEVDTYILFNHSSGFYTKLEANWYGQKNFGETPGEPYSSFFQENIYSGYRFARRRAELQLGILNLSGGGYNLDPLNVYQELPRKRVFEASFNFIF